MFRAANLLGIAVAGLIHVESELGGRVHEADTEETNDFECVVPIHGNLDIGVDALRRQILRLLERFGVKCGFRRRGDGVSPECPDTVERTYMPRS